MPATPAPTTKTAAPAVALTDEVVRALLLYALAEHQAGHASTIHVTVEGPRFRIEDDGRGHAIDRVVAGAPYLPFIYTQLDHPFDSAPDAPIQLQGIGMSLINALCSELTVTVHKAHARLRLHYRDARLQAQAVIQEPAPRTGTGNIIEGTVKATRVPTEPPGETLRQTLQRTARACPSLTLHFNGGKVTPNDMDGSDDA